MWGSYTNARCGNIPRDFTRVVLLKLAKFLDDEDLASDPVPNAVSESCY